MEAVLSLRALFSALSAPGCFCHVKNLAQYCQILQFSKRSQKPWFLMLIMRKLILNYLIKYQETLFKNTSWGQTFCGPDIAPWLHFSVYWIGKGIKKDFSLAWFCYLFVFPSLNVKCFLTEVKNTKLMKEQYMCILIKQNKGKDKTCFIFSLCPDSIKRRQAAG